MRRFLDGLYLLSGALAALCVFLILAIVGLQVLLNLTAGAAELVTGRPTGFLLPAYADFSGYLLVAATFLALPYAMRRGAHIRVTLLIQRTAGLTRRIMEVAGLVAAIAITLYAAWYAANLVHESWRFNDVAFGLVPVPLWIPQLPIPIGLAILAIALIDDLVAILSGKKPSFDRSEGLLTAASGNDMSSGDIEGKRG